MSRAESSAGDRFIVVKDVDPHGIANNRDARVLQQDAHAELPIVPPRERLVPTAGSVEYTLAHHIAHGGKVAIEDLIVEDVPLMWGIYDSAVTAGVAGGH